MEEPGSADGLARTADNRVPGSSINAFVTALELPETLTMLANAALAAGEAIKRFAKGDIAGGIKALGQEGKLGRRSKARVKAASSHGGKSPYDKDYTITDNGYKLPENIYLEYVFGWAPFIGDIQGALKALDKKYEKGKKFTGTASNNGEGPTAARATRMLTGYGNGQKSIPTRAGTKVTSSARVQNSQAALLNGIGVVNPIAALWEIIPYSFLVDYFVDVGGYLQSLTSNAGFSQYTRCVTTTSIRRVIGDWGGEKQTYVTITRNPYTGAMGNITSLFASGFTAGQTANMTALFAQKVRYR